MKKLASLMISLSLFTAATLAVHAHPAAEPHAHPHGASPLPGLDALVIIGLVVGAGLLFYAYRSGALGNGGRGES